MHARKVNHAVMSGGVDKDATSGIIKSISQSIDLALEKVYMSDANHVTIKLPKIFDIGPIKKNTSQLIVYTELIMIYGKETPDSRGFDVSIDIKNDIHTITLKWDRGIPNDEYDARIALLTRHIAK